MAEFGVRKAGLDEVLACDYVSLHCALTDETRSIIDAAALAQMRPTAYLINTARGGCVDTEALTAALAERRIAGSALDVVSPEPLPDGHPLYTMPNVIITPHTAFMSRVSEREAREKACLEVVSALAARSPAMCAILKCWTGTTSDSSPSRMRPPATGRGLDHHMRATVGAQAQSSRCHESLVAEARVLGGGPA